MGLRTSKRSFKSSAQTLLTALPPAIWQLLRNLLLWHVLLAWTGSYAVQAKPRIIATAATAGYVMQILMLHTGTLAQRELDSPQEWQAGTALYYIVAGSLGVRSSLASWLAQTPHVCRLLSYAVLGFDLAVPAVILTTSQQSGVRGWLLAAADCLHAAFYTLVVYLPQYALLYALSVSTAFLPTPWLDRLWPRAAESAVSDTKPQAVFATRSSGEKVASGGDTGKAAAAESPAAGLTRRRPQNASFSAADSQALQTSLPPRQPPKAKEPLRRKFLLAIAVALSWTVLAYSVMDWAFSDLRLLPFEYQPFMVGNYIGYYQGWMPLREARADTLHTWATAAVMLPPASDNNLLSNDTVFVDLLRALRTGQWDQPMTAPEKDALARRPSCPSCQLPSWRFERYLLFVALGSFEDASARAMQLCQHWCQYVDQQLARHPELLRRWGVNWQAAAIHLRLARYKVVGGPEPGVKPKFTGDDILIDLAKKCWVPEHFQSKATPDEE